VAGEAMLDPAHPAMSDVNHARRGHENCVESWLQRSVDHDSPVELARLLYRATDALWDRAVTTLGTVTLTAIVGRVFHRAEARYPFLANTHGLASQRKGNDVNRIAGVPTSEVIDGMRFALIELLAVVGRLTAEILTPELHAALHSVAPSKALEPGRPESRTSAALADEAS